MRSEEQIQEELKRVIHAKAGEGDCEHWDRMNAREWALRWVLETEG